MNVKLYLVAALSLAVVGCKTKSETAIVYDTSSATQTATGTSQAPRTGLEALQQQQTEISKELSHSTTPGAAAPVQVHTDQPQETPHDASGKAIPPMPKSTPTPEQPQVAPPALPPASALTRHGDTIVSPTGLKYIDMKPGEGAPPIAGDFVSVSFVGYLPNGKEFDRSTSFTTQIGVGSVIPAWDEGLISMKAGGKRRLIVPPKLAGSKEAGVTTPQHTVLIYDIDMLLIQK